METLSPENPPLTIDLLNLLNQKSAAAFYQPIISIKKKSVIGLEAIGRGIDPENHQLIEAEPLYQLSQVKNKSLDLDRLFRLKGLEGFQEIQSKIPGLLLFLRLETSVLTEGVVGSGHLLDLVQKLKLDPNSIVIELTKNEEKDVESVRKFVDNYRSAGFLISLRDVDASRASLDRVLRLNPDVFKLDPVMVSSLSKDSYKKDNFNSLVNLSRKWGALVIANGVESEEYALVALELGADMLQGMYFSKPQRTELSATLGLKARIVFVASRFKRQMTEKSNRDKDRKNKYEKIALSILDNFKDKSPEEMESLFPETLRLFPQLECLFLLNQDGVQSTETICNIRKVSDRRRFLFQPAPKTTDHSLKDYYYSLVLNGLDRYFTEPYISLASGNLCVTASGVLKDPAENQPNILCMDIDVTKI